jgi:DNA-binding NtrC family response regulator
MLDLISGGNDLRVLPYVRQVASSNLKILITGATGAGKDRVARYIHEHSPRRHGPFVTVNCAGLTLGELFGEGSQLGYLRMAGGGTLFLSDICDLSLTLQSCLLYTIQHGENRAVGETV